MSGPAGTGRPAEQRGSRRTKVFLVAELADTAPEGRRAHVLDISPEGARLHARSVAHAGSAVDLVVGGARQPASVVWVDHPNLGVRFARSLSADRLDAIVAGRAAADVPGGG